MTDNINIMRQYMIDLGIPLMQSYRKDLYFDVQLVRRGKDNKDMPAANYTFKTYYIDSIELFDKYIEEIKTCCELFRLRSYISVNAKSKIELSKKTLLKYAEMVATEEFKKPWRLCDSVNGSLDGPEKRWILDVDDMNMNDERFNKYCNIIESCDSKFEKIIVVSLPTKSGIHIITHPFNSEKFKNICIKNNLDVPDIKKNHITLLYENL